jgi:hypothetical protein
VVVAVAAIPLKSSKGEKSIVTCFISARGNNKRGFSGFN